MKNRKIIRLGALIVASATLLLSGCGSQTDADSVAMKTGTMMEYFILLTIKG